MLLFRVSMQSQVPANYAFVKSWTIHTLLIWLSMHQVITIDSDRVICTPKEGGDRSSQWTAVMQFQYLSGWRSIDFQKFRIIYYVFLSYFLLQHTHFVPYNRKKWNKTPPYLSIMLKHLIDPSRWCQETTLNPDDWTRCFVPGLSHSAPCQGFPWPFLLWCQWELRA